MKASSLAIPLIACLAPIGVLAQAPDSTSVIRQADFADSLLGIKERSVRVATMRQHKTWVSRLLWLALIDKGIRQTGSKDDPQPIFAFQVAEDVATEIGDKGLLGYALYREGYERFAEGDTEGALRLYLQSKSLFEEARSFRDEALVLNELGSLYILMGNYPEAESYSRKTLALQDSKSQSVSGLPAEYEYARAWSNLGEVSFWEGDYDAAVSCLQRAQALWEKLVGRNGTYRAYLVNTLTDIGNAYRMTGNYVHALEKLNQALNTAKALGDKRRVAASLVSIGVLYLDQRDYSKSEEFLNQSLALFVELKDTREIASAEINKGVLEQRLKNYDVAIGAFREALKQADLIPAPDLTVAAEEGIGVVYYDRGEYSSALEWFDKAWSLAREISDKLRITELLWRRGQVFYAQGDFDKAAASAKASADLATKLGSPLLAYLALALNGQVLRAERTPTLAADSFDRAINAVEEMRGQIAGSESEQELFFEDKLLPYHEMVSLLAEGGDAERALAYAEQAKARVLLDVLRNGRIELDKSLNAAEQSAEERLYGDIVSLNIQIRAERMRDRPDEGRIRPLEARLQGARNAYETFETSLYAEHPDLSVRRGKFPVFRIQDAAAVLPDSRTIILEYVVTDDHVFVFALTNDPSISDKVGVVLHSVKIKRGDLSEAIDRYRILLATNHPGFHEAGRKLYDLLVEPVEGRLRDKTTICIVPDGPLWNLPFQALQTAEDKYLLESSAIYYAPSLQVLRQMRKRSENLRSAPIKKGVEGHDPLSGASQSRQLYAVANPTISGDTLASALSRRNSAFGPLPETETEVRIIADSVYGAGESTVRIGAAAQEATVKAEIGKYRVIHFATHSVLDDDDPLYSYVILASGGDSHEDGLLEAREMMQMNLKAKLVVLSACDTARGRVGEGEGMIGMTWALFVAGVPTTVASQWQVPSESTTRLMVAFHKNLATRSA
ncbi:MAG: CHAT domain-containing protein, partial [Blastocatellia bacterium]